MFQEMRDQVNLLGEECLKGKIGGGDWSGSVASKTTFRKEIQVPACEDTDRVSEALPGSCRTRR